MGVVGWLLGLVLNFDRNWLENHSLGQNGCRGLAVKLGEQKGLHEETHTLTYACFENCVWFKLGMIIDLYRRVLEFVHREM